MTQAITPKSTTNVLVIEGSFFGSNSVAADVIVALHQDATANALAATANFNATATARLAIPFYYSMTAGTTSSTTFRVRVGSSSAGTISFNGSSGAREFGAISKSFIKIAEYKA